MRFMLLLGILLGDSVVAKAARLAVPVAVAADQ